jgi:uncharacterized protein (DUF433 family)
MVLSFHQIEGIIANLSFSKKAHLLYNIARQLGEHFPGIEKTANVCGGSACVIRTRIPVWTLVAFKKTGMNDAALLQSFPTLRRQDLINVWAYYKANKKEIDLDMAENEAA